jgi:hypothetical protein
MIQIYRTVLAGATKSFLLLHKKDFFSSKLHSLKIEKSLLKTSLKIQKFSHQHYTKVVLEAASEQDLTSVAAKLTENNIREEKKSFKSVYFLDQSLLFMLERLKVLA